MVRPGSARAGVRRDSVSVLRVPILCSIGVSIPDQIGSPGLRRLVLGPGPWDMSRHSWIFWNPSVFRNMFCVGAGDEAGLQGS